MLGFRHLIWVLCLVAPHAVFAADCEPGAAMTAQELAKHPYLRQEPASCELLEEQRPRFMWKLTGSASGAWPYEYAGQCTPAKGQSYGTYGCLAAEGCAIFVGKAALRVHVAKKDLRCKPGQEP